MAKTGRLISSVLSLAGLALFPITARVYTQGPTNLLEPSQGVQVGQLFVTPISIGTVSTRLPSGLPKSKKGYHFVVVNLRTENTTLYPNCTEWSAKIMTDAGREYGNQTSHTPEPLQMDRLPSRARSQGSYIFQVRDGENPIGLSLERLYEVERLCSHSNGFTPIEPFIGTVDISLDHLPEPTSPLQQTGPYPPQPRSPATQGKAFYSFVDPFGYIAAHNESNPQNRIKLLESYLAQNPNTTLLPFLYYDILRTYYELQDYPKTVTYADKLLSLGDKIDSASRNEIRAIRSDALGKMN